MESLAQSLQGLWRHRSVPDSGVCASYYSVRWCTRETRDVYLVEPNDTATPLLLKVKFGTKRNGSVDEALLLHEVVSRATTEISSRVLWTSEPFLVRVAYRDARKYADRGHKLMGVLQQQKTACKKVLLSIYDP